MSRVTITIDVKEGTPTTFLEDVHDIIVKAASWLKTKENDEGDRRIIRDAQGHHVGYLAITKDQTTVRPELLLDIERGTAMECIHALDTITGESGLMAEPGASWTTVKADTKSRRIYDHDIKAIREAFQDFGPEATLVTDGTVQSMIMTALFMRVFREQNNDQLLVVEGNSLLMILDGLHKEGKLAMVKVSPEVFSHLPEDIQASGWYLEFPLIREPMSGARWHVTSRPESLGVIPERAPIMVQTTADGE